MNLIVHQSIVIHQLRVEGISHSSVLQIGSAGVIRALSNAYNTGGYTEPAPALTQGTPHFTAPLVPLPTPT